MRSLLFVTLLSILLIAVLLMAACSEKPTGPMNGDNELLRLSLQLEEISGTVSTSFVVGDTIRMVLFVENLTDSAQVVRFPNCQQYDFVVCQEESAIPLWRWSSRKFFIDMTTSLHLEPWEIHSSSVLWDQRIDEGDGLGPGLYQTEGLLPGQFDPSDSTFTGSIRSHTIQFEIRLPD